MHRLKWTEGSTYSSIADAYAKFTLDLYGHATVVFDGYSGGPGIKDNTHQRRGANKTANKVNISFATKFVGEKEDFLSNVENKQAMIDLTAKCLQQKGCHVIQAEGDADVDIAKAAVSMSGYKSTTLIGEDTDLLILLLYHATLKDSHELYFRSDKTGVKTKQYVYNINVLKQILGLNKPPSLNVTILTFYSLTCCRIEPATSRLRGERSDQYATAAGYTFTRFEKQIGVKKKVILKIAKRRFPFGFRIKLRVMS